ncbi:MAG TPA: hypothetical protein PLI57_11370, partial [Spirochaetota bacterium]|nr:hypothetical protein [Spirochaetota bacterium]
MKIFNKYLTIGKVVIKPSPIRVNKIASVEISTFIRSFLGVVKMRNLSIVVKVDQEKCVNCHKCIS